MNVALLAARVPIPVIDPPTCKFFTTPTPPATFKAPVVVLDDCVVSLILIPLRAVIIPIESTFVTSSYVNVPPTDTEPSKVLIPIECT